MKNSNIKNKIIKHILKAGKKRTSEKLLLQSIKELQKSLKKQPTNLIKLALINSTPIFKLHQIRNKKQKKRKKKIKKIPAFISKTNARTSLAIKIILLNIKKNKFNNFYTALEQEFLLTSQQKGSAIDIKNDLQKEIILNKRFLKFFKW